ncbi:MAG: hypothetical protein LAO55_21815 [Acidobacteriia bacterium]|nr:hypothetical protein [Terriglobia bacterium]
MVRLELPELELDPVSAPLLNRIPDLTEAPLEASDLLGLLAPELLPLSGCSPELVAADPFEYEITCQPLPPSHVSSVWETKALPQGQPIPIWWYLGPQLPDSLKSAGAASVPQDSEIALCLPRSKKPAVGMRKAGRVGLPLTVALEPRPTAASMESNFQVLEMEPAPATKVVLEVPPQSDVLVELLDQQVPHPDRLHALSQFVAHQPAWAVACPPPTQFDATVQMALPAVASLAVAPAYQLFSAGMRQLPGTVLPAQGNVVNGVEISEIVVNPAGISVARMPVVASVNHMGLAGLRSLVSIQRPVQKGFALRTTDSAALDLSTGVSSDITMPSFACRACDTAGPQTTGLLPLTFGKTGQPAGDATRPEPIARLLPQAVEAHPVLPSSGLEPLDRKPPEDALRTKETGFGSWTRGNGLKKLEPAWAHATGFWQHAPRDLKLLLFAIPMLLALVFHKDWPRIASAAPQASTSVPTSFKRVLNDGLVNVRQSLESRAAIALDEDFRSGLDNWASPGGSTTEWSFDATGFVRPGPLAIYRPSVNLADYQVQFLGLIDKKALSWVVRAADFDNFYVVKLEVVKSGPIPVIGMTRYAVIGGKAMDRHDVTIPLNAREDTLYRVRMDMRGSDFTVEVQGQMADSWTETRLPRGGVGFFTASGEASRLRWVQITHQYDMLGRLCAYLAPYDTTNGSWQP